MYAFDDADAIPLDNYAKIHRFIYAFGWEAFYEQRRTGIPTLSVGPELTMI